MKLRRLYGKLGMQVFRDAIQLRYVYDITGSICSPNTASINLLKPTGHVMHQQYNIQQLYVLPTMYLCVLYLS